MQKLEEIRIAGLMGLSMDGPAAYLWALGVSLRRRSAVVFAHTFTNQRQGDIEVPLHYKCKLCGAEHVSPIAFGSFTAFTTSHLEDNHFQCPIKGGSASYSQHDMIWRDTYQVAAKSGNADVVSSGSVIGFRREPIELEFGPAESRIRVVFRFVDDKDSSETSMDGEVINGSTLHLTLTNFKSPLGMGSTEPLEVGRFGGRPLLLHFRVYSLGESDKMLHFTFYAAAEKVAS